MGYKFKLFVYCLIFTVLLGFALMPINVGVILPLTGAASVEGIASKLSIKLANNLYKVVGPYEINLIIKNQNSSAIEDRRLTKMLIDKYNVKAIIGWIYSSHALGGTPIAEEHKIPGICIYATNPLVTQGKKYISRIVFNDYVQGRIAAEYLYDSLKIKRIAVVMDTGQNYSMGLSSIFKDNFRKLGGIILTTYNINSLSDNYYYMMKSLAYKIINNGFKFLYMPLYSREIAIFLKFMGKYRKNVFIFSSDSAGFIDRYLDGETYLSNGIYYTDQYYVDYNTKNHMAELFNGHYRELYGVLPTVVDDYLTFDAYYVLYNAIKSCINDSKQPTSENINYYIRHTKNLLATTGLITIDPKTGDCTKSVYILKWENGKRLFIDKVSMSQR